ncbi:MAG: hypothetical protein LJE84_13180 [Gammaproteobacteria bacterium]|nr:hypothetical protein [Gammaproteobacteria bacterium]
MPDRSKRILPVVLRIRESIDALFLIQVGPIGPRLTELKFSEWTQRSNCSPLALKAYIDVLADYIDHDRHRDEFIRAATACIRLN